MIFPLSQLPREQSAKDTWTQQMVHHNIISREVWFLLWDNCCSFSVFVLDTGFHVFVWVGKDATSHEKGGGLMLAHVSMINIVTGCIYYIIIICLVCIFLHTFRSTWRNTKSTHSCQWLAWLKDNTISSLRQHLTIMLLWVVWTSLQTYNMLTLPFLSPSIFFAVSFTTTLPLLHSHPPSLPPFLFLLPSLLHSLIITHTSRLGARAQRRVNVLSYSSFHL